MSLEISSKFDVKDLVHCVRMYLAQNDESFIPSDFQSSIRNLHESLLRRASFHLIRRDGEIRAWILGEVGRLDHSDILIMRQKYYASDLHGVSALRALVLAHKELVHDAISQKVPIVMSTCSHMDETHQMCRILQREGWEARGHTARFLTGHPLQRPTTLAQVATRRNAATTPMTAPIAAETQAPGTVLGVAKSDASHPVELTPIATPP